MTVDSGPRHRMRPVERRGPLGPLGPLSRLGRRPRLGLLAVLVASAALLIGAMLHVYGGRGSAAPMREDLRADLALRIQAILERGPAAYDPSTALHDHGGQVDRIVCVVEPFGAEPASAITAAEVRVAYAHYFCAAGEPGTGYERSSRVQGPMVVDFSQPPRVRTPDSGSNYSASLRGMVPDRYQAVAFRGFDDARATEDQVKRQFLVRITQRPSAAPS
jgi:hypothetical protein